MWQNKTELIFATICVANKNKLIFCHSFFYCITKKRQLWKSCLFTFSLKPKINDGMLDFYLQIRQV